MIDLLICLFLGIAIGTTNGVAPIRHRRAKKFLIFRYGMTTVVRSREKDVDQEDISGGAWATPPSELEIDEPATSACHCHRHI
jgi:hypothetical protein